MYNDIEVHLPVMREGFTPEDSITVPFTDRNSAGRALVKCLESYRDNPDVIVLALPRGGVPVAKAIASSLNAPLDLLLVRKVGIPGQEELAMGAVASNDAVIWNEQIVKRAGVGRNTINESVQQALDELHRREKAYRGDRLPPKLKDRIVILVDDGLATGASMRAAVDAVRKQEADRVIVAVPVAPPDTVSLLKETATEVVCLITPEPFYGVGDWYLDFTQLTDTAVRELLDSEA